MIRPDERRHGRPRRRRTTGLRCGRQLARLLPVVDGGNQAGRHCGSGQRRHAAARPGELPCQAGVRRCAWTARAGPDFRRAGWIRPPSLRCCWFRWWWQARPRSRRFRGLGCAACSEAGVVIATTPCADLPHPGTTGFPKGVLHCSQSLIWAVRGQLSIQPITHRNVAMMVAPMNHHIGTRRCMTNVAAGLPVCVATIPIPTTCCAPSRGSG